MQFRHPERRDLGHYDLISRVESLHNLDKFVISRAGLNRCAGEVFFVHDIDKLAFGGLHHRRARDGNDFASGRRFNNRSNRSARFQRSLGAYCYLEITQCRIRSFLQPLDDAGLGLTVWQEKLPSAESACLKNEPGDEHAESVVVAAAAAAKRRQEKVLE